MMRALGPVDEIVGFARARLAQGLSIKVRGLCGRAGPGPVDKREGVGGWLAQGQPIKVKGCRFTGSGLAGPLSLANPHTCPMLSTHELSQLGPRMLN